MQLETRITSSLEKIFCRPGLDAPEFSRISCLKGETAAFQLAVKCGTDSLEVRCRAAGAPLAEFVTVREVGLVPCTLPAVAEDPHILTAEPGLFPNPLLPHDKPLRTIPHCWRAFWISVCVPEPFPAGKYELGLELEWHRAYPAAGVPAETFRQRTAVTVEVLPAVLAPQKLAVTLWFHTDCLMTRYGVPCWSREHWRIIGNYMRNLAAHGGTMLLTPLWTLPLDTGIGSERPTAQLLDITCRDGRYTFDFTRLERWIDLAFSCGFTRIEFPHFCSQWGAAKTPKIIIRTENGEEQRFGWHTASDSTEYLSFLSQLLPELLALLDRRGIRDACRFHVSDEPALEHLEHYSKMSRFVAGYVGGERIMDALSEPEFLESGACRIPVPVTTRVEAFRGKPVAERWVYYCGNWQNGVPNRQFGMPSARNRILGVLLYLYDFDGFLNWGYNFWYSALSRDQQLDPYADPCAGHFFRGGGSFIVYPGEDGKPVDSIHGEVFREALQDLRALRMLEEKIGRDATVSLIHEGQKERLSMNAYPRDAEWLLNLRERVNYKLA